MEAAGRDCVSHGRRYGPGGIWKAFQELRELGWLETQHLPRMVVVQLPAVRGGAAWESAPSSVMCGKGHTLAPACGCPKVSPTA